MLLWDVDTQVDFLSPQGRLYVPGAELLIPKLARLTACAHTRHWPIISSACAHLPGDPELETYGPHCMVGTPGQQKIPATILPDHYVVPNRLIDSFPAKSYAQIIIEKQAFDVFTNPNTDAVLHQFGRSQGIVLYGVVTEICVAAAAYGLLDRGHRVALVRDAIRALDTEKAADFVEDFLHSGGQLVTTDDVTCPGTSSLAA
ncbi:MAG TPA: isochorismatase family protein [Terriglobales bacterium]|nr:isochorismatase family protein [Terriglobales bacterium]